MLDVCPSRCPAFVGLFRIVTFIYVIIDKVSNAEFVVVNKQTPLSNFNGSYIHKLTYNLFNKLQ